VYGAGELLFVTFCKDVLNKEVCFVRTCRTKYAAYYSWFLCLLLWHSVALFPKCLWWLPWACWCPACGIARPGSSQVS